MSSSTPERVTLRDIALRLRLSSMTVSRALRDDPRITPARRELIRKTAEELNYRPDAMAVALRGRGNSQPQGIQAELAWLNHWKEPERLQRYREFALMWEGARAAAEKNGYRLREFAVGERLSFTRFDSILRSRGVQGILVPPHGGAAGAEPDEASLDWARYAVVRIGYSVRRLPAEIVVGNHLQGTLLALSRIAAKGYQRVGYVCMVDPSAFSHAGFLTFQVELPEERRVPLLMLQHGERGGRLRVLSEWLRAHRPDAILTEVGDLHTLLTELGVRVPEDIGLASTSCLDGPAEAGIDQHSDLIGQTAVETLIRLIHTHHFGLPERHREVLVQSSWRDGATLPLRVNDNSAAR
jgi:DNA-binding LacI/PurR family transcriptional regulator